jgi:hypothetical protein
MTPQEGVHSPTALNGTHANGFGAHYNANVVPLNNLAGAYALPGAQPYNNNNLNGGPGPQMGHMNPQQHAPNSHTHAYTRSGQYPQYPAGGFF